MAQRSSTTEQWRDVVRKHVLASRQYLGNGLEMLAKGETAKAGELLWGSVAQAVQALAVSRDKSIKTHRGLSLFVYGVAKEIEDRSIAEGFSQAERLHSNFHEVDMTEEDVAVLVESIRGTVVKLLSLIPKELMEEPEKDVG